MAKKLLKFDEFKKNKIKQSKEIPEIQDEPEEDELIDSPNAVELEDETKTKYDYYDVKQDFMTPKPFRKPSKK